MSTHTLLLRLSGPLQSWGSRSRFSERDTEREPTKSAVIGLLCASLGRPREASLADLVALRMGVRVDQEGTMQRDFQTALTVRKADPKAPPNTVISNRYYLSDAVFLVGLESSNIELLRRLENAIQAPVWAISLGRRSCVPAESIYLQDGLRENEKLEFALRTYPFLGANGAANAASRATLRIVVEVSAGSDVRSDVPISFADRTFTVRHVQTEFCSLPKIHIHDGDQSCT